MCCKHKHDGGKVTYMHFILILVLLCASRVFLNDKQIWNSGRKVINCTVVYELTRRIHSQREDYWLFVALALSGDKERAGSFDIEIEMHVHSCTLSVSMHIETVSLRQKNIHSTFSLRVVGFKKNKNKKCPPQAERDSLQPIKCPWIITKLQLLCTGTRW